jgi:hypothetical protein
MKITRASAWFGSLSLMALLATAPPGAQAPQPPAGQSFLALTSGFTQELIGVASGPPLLGDVAVLPSGQVIASECVNNTARLHRYSPASTYQANGTTLWSETVVPSAGGCGAVLHPDGFLYSNIDDSPASTKGIVKIDPITGATVKKFGPRGNALGITVDPTNHHLVYVGRSCSGGTSTCTLFDVDPVTETVTNFAQFKNSGSGSDLNRGISYVDGVYFDPTGQFMFVAVRLPYVGLAVVDRSGQVLQKLPTSSEPVGMVFRPGSPKFVVSNNSNGSMTRFDFPGDDYSLPPTATPFATGGFRGDLVSVGPDGCVYLTQAGTRFDNLLATNQNSVMRVCGGFAAVPTYTPPPPSSLCGFVYHDADNDGAKDPLESGINGVSVALTGVDYLRHGVSLTVATDASGQYCFHNLARGTYSITESPAAGYLDGKETQGSPGNGSVAADAFTDIVLAAGVSGSGNNFGEIVASSLCGFVYSDVDNNGIKDGGEAGIGGVALALTGTDDRNAAVTLSIASGGDGGYCGGNLRPGTYSISETAEPIGFIDGVETQGTPGTGTAGNDVFSNIAVTSGTNGANNNFGEIPAHPSLSVVMKTNLTDNDEAPGLLVPNASNLTWSYVVTNTGDVPLLDVKVVDTRVGAIPCATRLGLAERVTCSATGVALPGQYSSSATTTARGAGLPVSGSNPEHSFGAISAIGVVTKTNGTDNNSGTGPSVIVGAPITWTYTVTNLGNVALSSLKLHDDRVGAIDCPSTALAPDMSVTCTATGTAKLGQYVNVGSASAVDPLGRTVTGEDGDRYVGATRPPVCTTATASPAMIWPPNHKFVDVRIAGVTDPDNDPVTIKVTGITQDEPTLTPGSGRTSVDGIITATAARVRAERSGQLNGRLYFIGFAATDDKGGACSGVVTVGVPHDQGGMPSPIDSGFRFNSTVAGTPRVR